jgi:tetratricopeptide (TPR) repeat protein/O-antigen ligase
MLVERRLEWRCSALDFPLALLVGLVLVQLTLGNRPLATWALAPPGPPDAPASVPALFLALGTVAPAHTARSLLLLLTYAGAYVLVVNLIRTRRQLDRLVSTLLILGGLLAFFSLLDYLTREVWLLRWRDSDSTGRLSGTFVNADHFASWLTMLIFLGLGYLMARGRAGSGRGRLLQVLRSREGSEQAARHYLPFPALVVMALALVFTLSRGGVLSFLVAAGLVVLLLRALGRIRRSLAVVGALLVATVGYGAWIGLEPFLARVWHADYSIRWVQWLATLPMLRAFPLFGVGLGAYRDAYLRYQPTALTPGKLYFPAAHNDLLQLAVELGLIGAALVLFMAWRVGKDLVGAHLLARASCPVGGGERDGARRSDPFSVGLGVGAVGAVLALLVHSVYDFGARITANGVLAATCLGIATVAFHTRFQPTGDRVLTSIRSVSLERRPRTAAALSAMAVALCVAFVPWIVRPPLAAGRLAEAQRSGVDRPTVLRWTDAALAIEPRGERALDLRGRLRLEAALQTWNVGLTADGRVLRTWEERRRESLPLLRGAAEDFRTAIAEVPTDPSFQNGMGRVSSALAQIDTENAPQHLAAARAAFSRAVALAPHDPLVHRSLAVFAVPQGGRFTEIGLHAARDSIHEDPGLLPGLVDHFLPLGLTGAQWVAMVPESALDLADVGALLEEQGLPSEAAYVYGHGIRVAPAGQAPLMRWMLARLLLRRQQPKEALGEVDAALVTDPDNPELYLARAQALAALGDPDALAIYRLAALKAGTRAQGGEPAAGHQPFESLPPRGRALVTRVLQEQTGPARYHRALAQYLTDRRLWHQALAEWETVLVETPRDAWAQFSRGTVLDGLGTGDLALQAYREAVTLDPTRIEFRLRLAQRLWDTEQYHQAMNEWRSVVAQDPGAIEARLGLARANAKAGDRLAATQEYARILQIAPDQPEARREMARLGRSAGR